MPIITYPKVTGSLDLNGLESLLKDEYGFLDISEAVLVVLTAYESWMLSHYIITDIYEKLFDEEEDADYETLKQEFLDDLKEFECDELGGDPDDKAYIKHLKEIGDMIGTFVYYFTLGVR